MTTLTLTYTINFIQQLFITFFNIKPLNTKNLYIDMDGTLLDSSLDKRFNLLFNKSNHPTHQSKVISWYRNNYNNSLKINYKLLYKLLIYKFIFNHTLILWTNRGQENIPMTKSNLNIIWYIFSDHQFYGGQKSKTTPDGIIFDNEPKYLKLNNHNNILINF